MTMNHHGADGTVHPGPGGTFACLLCEATTDAAARAEAAIVRRVAEALREETESVRLSLSIPYEGDDYYGRLEAKLTALDEVTDAIVSRLGLDGEDARAFRRQAGQS